LILRRVYNFLANSSQNIILGLSFLLLVLICVFDYVIGSDFEVDLFYLLPLVLLTWFAKLKWAIGTTLLSTLAWAMIDKTTGKISPSLLVDVWNASLEFSFFLAFVGVLSMLKRNMQRLDDLANEDALTGVANRRSFFRVAKAEINRSQRFGATFSVVYIDVDNFKLINDMLGHSVGDALLRETAATIRRHIRDIDTVARLGGDEFAVLFPETNAEGSKHIFEKIYRQLSEMVVSHGWSTTFSVGVVTFTKPPASVEEMIEFSDKVMYSVKRQGKNNVSFESWPESTR
jgi:diguanylate cyclase (GGDEF)-like protein